MAHDQSYLRIYGTIQLWNIDFHLLFSTFLHVYGPNNAQKNIRERKEKVIKWWWWWWEFATKSHQLMYACYISNKKKKRVNNKKNNEYFSIGNLSTKKKSITIDLNMFSPVIRTWRYIFLTTSKRWKWKVRNIYDNFYVISFFLVLTIKMCTFMPWYVFTHEHDICIEKNIFYSHSS